jgi:hypothetical protein
MRYERVSIGQQRDTAPARATPVHGAQCARVVEWVCAKLAAHTGQGYRRRLRNNRHDLLPAADNLSPRRGLHQQDINQVAQQVGPAAAAFASR